ncbi:uncharacterized protein LTHEOB_12269 [Lasiodiplodia theobromae]|uniref:uncharacterized protein n=1 Tax=Lasiodiplodia theobromae TaxID=45133 RepID=UPI0015C3CDB6|nr:uncharacterized protein LTHEOB_12269 [Lasiodiplodia theobromae]KAF4536073.1 hypothetical protein LTHEOB_12269 [Lasiodiplodia theobromae]
MPTPDYACKVINLSNGYYRENKSWLIGRLMRDNEAFMTKRLKGKHEKSRALRIAIYDPSSHIPKNIIRPVHLTVALLQLAIAVIPLVLHGDWSSLLVTTAGTVLATTMGLLPQWKAEKFPTTLESDKTIAITAGNGSKDIIIVRGTGSGMDLERLAAAEGPRGTRPWERWGIFKHSDKTSTRVITFSGLPVDFWLTRIICAFLALCWLGLLILVAGIQSNTWYLLVIGAMGMFQNAFVAGVSINPEGQPISLLFKEVIYGYKAMDALMDLEVKLENDEESNTVRRFDLIKPLLKDFFPGELTGDEMKWWQGDRHDYDEMRMREVERRGSPRSRWDFEKPRPLTPDSMSTDEGLHSVSKYPPTDMDSRIASSVSEQVMRSTERRDRSYEETDPDDMIYQVSPGLA